MFAPPVGEVPPVAVAPPLALDDPPVALASDVPPVLDVPPSVVVPPVDGLPLQPDTAKMKAEQTNLDRLRIGPLKATTKTKLL